MPKKNFLIFAIFMLGIFHWFSFWYAADYYSYNNITPVSSFELDQKEIKTYNLNHLKKIRF